MSKVVPIINLCTQYCSDVSETLLRQMLLRYRHYNDFYILVQAGLAFCEKVNSPFPYMEFMRISIGSYHYQAFTSMLNSKSFKQLPNWRDNIKELTITVQTEINEQRVILQKYPDATALRQLQDDAQYSSCAAVEFDLVMRDYSPFIRGLQFGGGEKIKLKGFAA